ncbi:MULTISPECIES: DUF1833 family protein [Pandoraea]|uniref:DUF1833 domain-containing protein n=1 Tax=Pandoraea commovens TaxID=2508289 RepID=A0A5E4SGP4_9BURK|nr:MULTISPECIES: DUF1833 family protein [Pandoraea]VVD74341.1 hypothetical protein PCO31010_00792 [Pandoraea commovens]
MAREYTPRYRQTINAVSAPEPRLLLLQIDHPDLAVPVRVVCDTQDVTSNGNVYTAMAFGCSIPDDQEGQLPQAQLEIDNVGRELTQWLEVSQGGLGATATFSEILRSVPDHVEWGITMDMSRISMTQQKVSATLGFPDTLNQQGVAMQFRPDTAPGLF